MQARWSTATPRIDGRLNDFCFCFLMLALEVCWLGIFAIEYACLEKLPLDYEHSFFGVLRVNARHIVLWFQHI